MGVTNWTRYEYGILANSFLILMLWSFIIFLISYLTNSVIALISLLVSVLLLYYSHYFILWTSDSETVPYDELPIVHSKLSKISTQADVSKPDIAVIDCEVPNAYTTGTNSENATITLTSGLIHKLNPNEIEAVLAHEISHVKNRDISIVMFFTTLFIASHHVVQYGYEYDGDGKLHYIVGFLITIPFWLCNLLLVLSIFRYREYIADRNAVKIIGSKEPLLSALQKLSNQNTSTKQDLRDLSGTNTINIISASNSYLFSTHPSLSSRIKHIKDLDVVQDN